MSATYKPTTGARMKAYINTGTRASPTYVEVSEIGDLNVSDFSRNFAELKRRANDFTKGIPSLMNMIGVEFRLHFGLGRTVYDLIRAAHLAGSSLAWAFMNGAIATNGHQGLTFTGGIEQFPWDQGLENVAGHDVRIVNTYDEDAAGEIDPYWFIVGTTTTTTTTTT